MELIFADQACLEISRELIFAEEHNLDISRELIFADGQIFQISRIKKSFYKVDKGTQWNHKKEK